MSPGRPCPLCIAADVGGTFTDVAVFDEGSGQIRLGKTLATPARLIEGMGQAVGKASARFADARLFLHGTTVAINALLERKGVHASVAERRPEAAVVAPPRADAVPSDAAGTAPTQRGGHLRRIAERGRMAWRNAPGCNRRARVEAAMNRWKQAMGEALRARTDERRATEVAVAAHALNRTLDLGRSNCVRVASPQARLRAARPYP